MILPQTELVTAYKVGERIPGTIAERRITTDAHPAASLRVAASFGIAAYPESRAIESEDLVRRADRAPYRTKQTGTNRVELSWSDDAGPARPPADPAEHVHGELTPNRLRSARRHDSEGGWR